MTQTPYILWAVLATGGAVAVYLMMRREVAKARARAICIEECFESEFARAENLAGQVASLKKAVEVQAHATGYYARRATDLEDRLRKIEQARHLSAKHARQAQLSQQRAKVLEQASKLVAPKVDRIAA